MALVLFFVIVSCDSESYEEERRIRKVSIEELAAKNKELERKLKQKEKELADEKETVEILKKIYEPNIAAIAS